jgi:hypothetical protein
MEVALGTIEARVWLVFAGLQVGVDEFNKAIQVLGRNSLVLLVEVVDIAVEDLHEELDGDSGIHTGVCNTERTLEALENPFTIAVELKGESQ